MLLSVVNVFVSFKKFLLLLKGFLVAANTPLSCHCCCQPEKVVAVVGRSQVSVDKSISLQCNGQFFKFPAVVGRSFAVVDAHVSCVIVGPKKVHMFSESPWQ